MSDSRPLSDRLLSLLQAGHIRLSDARAMIDAAPPDPLVADLVEWLNGGGCAEALDDRARTAGRVARLSAVVAAARAMLSSDDETNGRVPGWIVEDLRSALAAADAAIAPEKP